MILASAAFAWEKDRPAIPPVVPPNPNNLPKVLLIGDSTSGGYHPLVAKALEGKAQKDDDVHFSGGGNGLLAKQVADCILQTLGSAEAVDPVPRTRDRRQTRGFDRAR